MDKWYCSKAGNLTGPYKASRIADMVLHNEIDIDESLQNAASGLWVKVKDIPAVMEIIHAPLATPAFDAATAQQFAEFVDSGVPLDQTYPLFYNMPAKRLLFIQIITLGMFEMYWFYKQWEYLRASKKGSRLSYWRAMMFFIFLAYVVFRKIETDRDLNKAAYPPWRAYQLALIWYLVVPALSFNPLGSVAWLVGPLSLLSIVMLTSLVLVPVQSYINKANDRMGRPLSKPSFGYYFTIILSVGVWVGGVARYLF